MAFDGPMPNINKTCPNMKINCVVILAGMMYSLVGMSDRDAIGFDTSSNTNQSGSQTAAAGGASSSAGQRRGRTNEAMAAALDASGCEIVTVALRRADLSGKGDPFANILDFIDPKKFLLLPNTSGAINAEEAVRLARLARAAGIDLVLELARLFAEGGEAEQLVDDHGPRPKRGRQQADQHALHHEVAAHEDGDRREVGRRRGAQ